MFSLIVLLRFSESLAHVSKVSDQTKYHDETFMVRPTLLDMNPVELKYFRFVISINKSTESFNILSPKTCVQKEAKDIYIRAFNMITNKKETKRMKNIFFVIVNANSIVWHVIQNKRGITKHVKVNVNLL